MEELDTDTCARIRELSERGDALAEAGDYEAAISTYDSAWQLVPEPKAEWEASTWLLAAIADAGYLGGFFNTARRAIDFAMVCPGALGNPFLHLRRGEVLYEQGELDGAAGELLRAYVGAGSETFESEPPRYLTFLRARAVIWD